MKHSLRYFFCCYILVAFSCFADEVSFNNGDHLTGKVISVIDGKLTINTDIAGPITIELSKISTFSTNEPAKVLLKDGTVLNQKIVSSDVNMFAIESDALLTAQKFPLLSISALNPPPVEKPTWHGDFSAAIASTHGNTRTDNFSGSLNLKKRTEKDRTTIGATYVESKQKDPTTGVKSTTENWWRIKGKYDYFFSEKFYAFTDVRYEKDEIAELDRRVIIGLGGGYQWIESEKTNFSTEAGIASLYEKYKNQTDSTTELSAQVGYHFDTKLRDNLSFIHDLTYYPSMQQPSDYFLTTSTELRARINDIMFTNFRVIFDYDASPAAGKGGTDTKYIWGIGGNF